MTFVLAARRSLAESPSRISWVSRLAAVSARLSVAASVTPEPSRLEAGARCSLRRASSSGARGQAASSPVPVRPVLAATSYRQAWSLGQKADGRKINQQTWNIVPKIERWILS